MTDPDRELDAPPPAAYPTFTQAIVLTGLLVLWQIVSGMGIVAGLAAFGWPAADIDSVARVPWVDTLTVACGWLPVLVYAFRQAHVPARRVCRWQGFNPLLLVAVLAVLTGLDILVSELDNASRLGQAITAADAKAFNAMAGFNVAALVTYGLLRPWASELLFRGVVFRGLTINLDAYRAVLGSALLGALAALLLGSAVGFFRAVGLGLFLGWVYYHTRSFWLVILGSTWQHLFGWGLGAVAGVWVPNFNRLEPGFVGLQPMAFDLLAAGLILVGGVLCTRILLGPPRLRPPDQ